MICDKGGQHHLIIAFHQSVAPSANVAPGVVSYPSFGKTLAPTRRYFFYFESSQMDRISVYSSVYRSDARRRWL